jgi:cell division protein FtsQ
MVGLFALIGFAEKKQSNKICKNVQVHIEDVYATYFIDENDVLGLLTHNGTERIIGASFKNIDLKNLELRLKTNKFIRSCQVYTDLKGELNVEIQQCRPIARIIQRNAPDAYISEEGTILPISDRFTARVVLVEGAGTARLLEENSLTKEERKAFVEFLRYIDEEKFWKAQIAHITVDRSGAITMYPQVGKQVIEFGTAVDIEQKFNKLKIFYKQILPVKGWNRYKRVNLAYQNQIICE